MPIWAWVLIIVLIVFLLGGFGTAMSLGAPAAATPAPGAG